MYIGVISELQQILMHRKSKLQELSEEVSDRKAESWSLKKENENLKQLLFKRSTDVSMAKEAEMLRKALGQMMEQTAAERYCWLLCILCLGLQTRSPYAIAPFFLCSAKVAAQAAEIKQLKARLDGGSSNSSRFQHGAAAANLELQTPRASN